ncbi:MAG: hypothetical protein KGI79_00225 [Patescibacteria group bacterium]|nr:hypothetical protein [Patescibacteria group bacterium]MDE2116297.1 hypothetical protein [Patescibacteria group bacterium]
MNNIKHRKALFIVIAVIAALLVFQAGVFVGYHKALFSYRGDERYFGMIEKPAPGMAIDDFSPSHGAVGKVVSVTLPSFVVESPDNREETVIVDNGTSVRMFRGNASTTDIKPDEFVVVLGEPDQAGDIEARFVRVMPAPGGATTTLWLSTSTSTQ